MEKVIEEEEGFLKGISYQRTFPLEKFSSGILLGLLHLDFLMKTLCAYVSLS